MYQGPEEGKFGIQHVFRQDNGEIVVLNSAGHLNWLLENHAPTGSLCNVSYAEKILLTKGAFKGKDAHNFELEVDDEDGGRVVRKDAMPVAAVSESDDLSL